MHWSAGPIRHPIFNVGADRLGWLELNFQLSDWSGGLTPHWIFNPVVDRLGQLKCKFSDRLMRIVRWWDSWTVRIVGMSESWNGYSCFQNYKESSQRFLMLRKHVTCLCHSLDEVSTFCSWLRVQSLVVAVLCNHFLVCNVWHAIKL